jgi:polyferredoxin
MHDKERAEMVSVRDIARWTAAVLIFLICTATFVSVTGPDLPGGSVRRFHIKANQYAYAPRRIVVNQGDEVHIRLASGDVVHGFFMEGYDRDAFIYPGRLLFNLRRPSVESTFVPVEEMVFRADRFGKYRYRCSVACGTLHPFMQGELIVEPNYPYRAGLGAAAGILVAGLFLMFSGRHAPPPVSGRRLDLIEALPFLGWLLRRRWFQFFFTLPGLAFFLLFIIAGFWGSPIGNRNIIITFVWILWWFLLITVLLPLGSRIWCLACPFPFFGEWIQRRRLISVREDARTMWQGFRKWPSRFSNIWAQNLLFLGLCTMSAVLVTRPVTTAAVLLALVLAATALAAVYRHRSFCNFLCPVSGFLSLYAMSAAVEVRPRDPAACRSCRTQACAAGSARGWGCPWALNPGRLARNNYCGMCMECIKTCPNGNMTLNLRPFCSDTHIKSADEAWKAMIMVSVALVYSITLLGTWGTVKAWANISEVGDWGGFLIYSGIIWVVSLAVLPGIWASACGLGRWLAGSGRVSAKTLFLRYAYLLVPLGLTAWAAFSFPLFMVNWSYIRATVSDPLGWGWNLLGTAEFSWQPLFPESMVYIQIPLLLIGLIFSLKRGYTIAFSLWRDRREAALSLVPPAAVCTVIVMTFVALFAG